MTELPRRSVLSALFCPVLSAPEPSTASEPGAGVRCKLKLTCFWTACLKYCLFSSAASATLTAVPSPTTTLRWPFCTLTMESVSLDGSMALNSSRTLRAGKGCVTSPETAASATASTPGWSRSSGGAATALETATARRPSNAPRTTTPRAFFRTSASSASSEARGPPTPGAQLATSDPVSAPPCSCAGSSVALARSSPMVP
mmetsp:Transcript_33502/g.90672  ORF Transcript_33502/g.90672 Transcript_33502/m.90672 type:complete len:201 (-) Transcript_33502:285-887(-)